MIIPPGEIVIRGDGLVLREWDESDVGTMVTLFDEESIDIWTPLEAPFDVAAAVRYLDRARRIRDKGIGIQLAITANGIDPLGEVLLFDGGAPQVAELAYAVGLAHRGHRLASRAVQLTMDFAAGSSGISAYVLKISLANVASQRVAADAGFTITGEPLEVRERKGRRLEMAVWRRDAASCARDYSELRVTWTRA